MQEQGDGTAHAYEALDADIFDELDARGELFFIVDGSNTIGNNFDAIGEEESSLVEGGRTTTEAARGSEGCAEAGVELFLPVAIGAGRSDG